MLAQVRLSAVIATLLVSIGLTGSARAQAWVGDQGALDLGLDYQLSVSSKVVADEMDYPDTGTTSHQILVGAEYVPIPKLAVNVALPLQMLKYTGDPAFIHPGGGSYDDGDYHTTFTDLRAGARYQVLDEPVALAPHLAFTLPVADYETVGNTVAGRHLKMLHVGLGVGTILGTSSYVHLLYEFTLAEKYDRTPETEQHSQNRSDVAFTIGHTLLDLGLDIHLDANMRRTHGGVTFEQLDAGELSPSEADYHDAILDEDILLVGGGIGYRVNNALSLSLSGRLFVAGTNTQNASVVALGVAWTPITP